MIKVRFADSVQSSQRGATSTHLKRQKLIYYIYFEVSLHRITTLTLTHMLGIIFVVYNRHHCSVFYYFF